HASRATVAFSMPEAPAALLDQLGRLDGVRDVQRTGTQVAVHGNRQIIAHVGAALVAHGRVPADLSAHVPDLEDALLRLLEPEPGAAEPGPAAAASHDLTGGRR
ncbi:MAG TPA: hypothetical protein VN597_04075, partial [Streptosporangiaceae bacterium]|nr:hypothetical protein [Streptosporangiaceae bacterium]